jgi:hypothetical protein
MPELPRAIRLARSHVDRACNLLLAPSPATLEACTAELETAVAALSGIGAAREGKMADPAARDEALRLQAAVGAAGRLLQGAAAYHVRWAAVLGALTAGYTGRGEAAPLAPPRPASRRICLSG